MSRKNFSGKKCAANQKRLRNTAVGRWFVNSGLTVLILYVCIFDEIGGTALQLSTEDGFRKHFESDSKAVTLEIILNLIFCSA